MFSVDPFPKSISSFVVNLSVIDEMDLRQFDADLCFLLRLNLIVTWSEFAAWPQRTLADDGSFRDVFGTSSKV